MDEKASVSFTLWMSLYISRLAVFTGKSFPCSGVNGTMMSNGMVALLSETEISSGRKLEGLYQDFGKARLP